MKVSTLLFALLALLPLVLAQDDPTPIQQRIALLPNGMTVSWSTLGAIAATPSVVYGLTPGNMTAKATGWSAHYDPSITYFHHVMLTDLTPSTRYYWKVTSPSTVNSTTLTFTTAPVVGSKTPFTVWINGDMGLVNEDNTVKTMTKWVQEDKIDLFYHVGDLAYADDWQDMKTTYEKVQEEWMSLMQPIWSGVPYLVSSSAFPRPLPRTPPAYCSPYALCAASSAPVTTRPRATRAALRSAPRDSATSRAIASATTCPPARAAPSTTCQFILARSLILPRYPALLAPADLRGFVDV
jgi:hypothetical protein